MKNKKGFTLIELLAVIVILAIIALIATPIVLNIINDTKKSSSVRSLELYYEAVKEAIARENLKGEFNVSYCSLENDNMLCDNSKILNVEVDGKVPDAGYILFENGKINGYYFELDGEIYTETNESCYAMVVPGEINYYDDACSSNQIIPSYLEVKTIKSATFDYEKCINEIENLGGSTSNCEDVRNLVNAKNYEAAYSYGSGNFINAEFEGTGEVRKVEKIGVAAFFNKNIENIVIPSTVQIINPYSFANTNLQKIYIPNSVTKIESISFANTKLKSVSIPDSVTSIGNFAFAHTDLSSKGEIKDVTIGNGVIDIGESSFYNNSIENLKLGNNVKNIYKRSFENNNLSELVIPDSVTDIWYLAFFDNPLKKLYIGTNNSKLSKFEFPLNAAVDHIFSHDENFEIYINKNRDESVFGDKKIYHIFFYNENTEFTINWKDGPVTYKGN